LRRKKNTLIYVLTRKEKQRKNKEGEREREGWRSEIREAQGDK